MTVTCNARLAGVAYLVYIVGGIGSMAAPPENRGICNTVTSFSALTLGVTLYALTRDVDRDLALLAVQLTLGTSTNWSSPVTWFVWLPMLIFELAFAVWLLTKGVAPAAIPARVPQN